MKRVVVLIALVGLCLIAGCMVAEYTYCDPYCGVETSRVYLYPDPCLVDLAIWGGLIYGLTHGKVEVHHYYWACPRGRVIR
ncbi:MAG: hypothetical protein DRP82_07145 [Planctomycetota bacterium]|nr:MAG: hypothetical protein DRP82_07145 [Planctomycetota bacterium]